MRAFLKYAVVMAAPLILAAGAAHANMQMQTQPQGELEVVTESQAQPQPQAQQQWPDGGNPSVGATLYDTCVPCHTLNGNGIAGKSISDLMNKMKAYQGGTYSDEKLAGMHKVLAPLSDQQLLDLAAYINKM